MSDIFTTLASSVRRDILSMLKERDMTAGEISNKLTVTKPTLSGHLNILKATDLVVTERCGTTITYSLNTSVVDELLANLVGLLSKNEEKE